MLQKVINYIDQYNMLHNGDKVIVALSGGPDSMCLVHILKKLQERYNIKLYAAHVNHCLRGAEADADEEYVRGFCKNANIDFYSKRIDINELARITNTSTETAGREARYAFFNELKEKLGANLIALAHNANDQAETILMRIIRGTGMEGLRGIRPVRDGIYIRPILILTREEIEEYCRINKLNPRIDKSNFEKIYNRNKIRLELIPYLQENFNKDILNTVNRLSEIISKDQDYLEEVAEKKYKEYCSIIGEKIGLDQQLINEHEAIVTRVIRRALKDIKGDLKNIELVHINEIMELFSMGTGKMITLPEGIIAEKVYTEIFFYKKKGNNLSNELKDEIIIFDKEKFQQPSIVKAIDGMNVKISLRIVTKDEVVDFSQDPYKKYFDYDKINRYISIRTRQEGDRFTPYGMKGSKKLKDLFIDLKIPKEERNTLPLVCFDKEIAWIVGYRVSNKYIVTKNTNYILEIKIEKGEN
ncbi:tRNA(Ile)-lysidine synthase [Clostridium sp. N3C]|uniref:tRNA lysidine(34) synthetase TilS n=1 Tax=Clostridium sp. N3C TaxID=1776758 RepID=UPI00092DF8F7|nr:tRNA lysidine(34) synthetase TilS [Clostridium sp. N3C]SCN23144.1 tRNA(Ile)-lysidine synthase [Clostridium sp. N3C]